MSMDCSTGDSSGGSIITLARIQRLLGLPVPMARLKPQYRAGRGREAGLDLLAECDRVYPPHLCLCIGT